MYPVTDFRKSVKKVSSEFISVENSQIAYIDLLFGLIKEKPICFLSCSFCSKPACPAI